MCDVTVVIPTLPARRKTHLTRALASVEAQTHLATAVIVERDNDRTGAAATRNRAIEQVETEWTAFLDDDDYLLPDHLAVLCDTAREHDADVVWPWFRVEGGTDPFPMHRGRQWNPQDPHIFPITTLVRTSLLREVGGFSTGTRTAPDGRVVAGEDWRLWNALSAAGARFRHVDKVTWVWVHWGGNQSGMPR